MKHYCVPGTVLHACINLFKPHSTTQKSAILLLAVYTPWRKWSVVRLNKLQRLLKWWRKEASFKQACPGAQFHPLLPVYTDVAELDVNGCDGHSHMPPLSEWNVLSKHLTYGYLEKHPWGCAWIYYIEVSPLIFLNTSDPSVLSFPESDLKCSHAWMRQ